MVVTDLDTSSYKDSLNFSPKAIKNSGFLNVDSTSFPQNWSSSTLRSKESIKPINKISIEVINKILNREHIYNELKNILLNFDKNFLEHPNNDSPTYIEQKQNYFSTLQLPLQATENGSSSTLCADKSLNFGSCDASTKSVKFIKTSKKNLSCKSIKESPKIVRGKVEPSVNKLIKKGIYIYGSPGCGKTEFVNSLLKELNYDVISYDAGDVRNKILIENMTSNNISSYNVLQMMKGVKTKIAFIMDEIDGMNTGDKGGITALIRLIRQKKTKKQKLENKTVNPIICIGNYYVDKKINELIKVCNSFELKEPTREQMKKLLKYIIPEVNIFGEKNFEAKNEFFEMQLPSQDKAIGSSSTLRSEEFLKCKKTDFFEEPIEYKLMLDYIQGDMRKLFFIKKLYETKPEIISEKYLKSIFQVKLFNEEPKVNTYKLFKEPISINQHLNFMNETDRTIIALLWHENIIDLLEEKSKQNYLHLPSQATSNWSSSTLCSEESINFFSKKASAKNVNLPTLRSEESLKYKNIKIKFNIYLKILNNICFADYIDRVTFQNQIWVLNEMSSLIKTFYNNQIYHNTFNNFSTLHSEKFIFGTGDASAKNVISPLQDTKNGSSSALRTEEFLKCKKNSTYPINSHSDIRFTKVLTKYSTEYNNVLFFYKLSQELNMDKKDVITFFQEIKLVNGESFLQNTDILNKVEKELENYNISKLDIRRIYRYLDKNVKKENIVLNNEDLEEELDLEED